MTQLSEFTTQEQYLLANTPLAAATAVAVSESGGGRQEASALLQAWRTANSHVSGSELVTALIVQFDPETRADQEIVSSDQAATPPTAEMMQAEAVQLCRQAVQILEAKAPPEEVDAYKRFVLYIVAQVAQASTNGGIFGFGGGVSVSLEEQTALRAIRIALDYTPPELSL